MNTRLTIDFKDPNYIKKLKYMSADQHKPIREIIVDAVDAYFSGYLENQAVLKLAEKSFKEWDNSLDADYDLL